MREINDKFQLVLKDKHLFMNRFNNKSQDSHLVNNLLKKILCIKMMKYIIVKKKKPDRNKERKDKDKDREKRGKDYMNKNKRKIGPKRIQLLLKRNRILRIMHLAVEAYHKIIEVG
jgi:hypothetical protein